MQQLRKSPRKHACTQASREKERERERLIGKKPNQGVPPGPANKSMEAFWLELEA